MRRCVLFLLGAWLSVGALLGKGLKIQLIAEFREYLPGEALHCKLRIKNISDQPVILGQHPDWIKFTVFDTDLKPVLRRDVPPPGDVFIVPGMRVTEKYFKLGPYFNLSEQGRYSIQAHVHVREWKQTIQANAVQVRVIQGLPIMSLSQGISDPLRKNQPPEIRKFTLVRKRNEGRIHLYLRVAEEEGKRVYNVLPLGGMVSFAKPEFYLDKSGRAHAMFQNGSRSYLYCVADISGNLLKRQTHEIYRSKRPAFALDDRGELVVRGGRRVADASDIPRSKRPYRPLAPLPAKPPSPRPGKRP